MGLFGTSKTLITPESFVDTQLERIFSQDFISAETQGFTSLSLEFPFLKTIDIDFYLEERQNIISNLFRIAWDRTIPYEIFIRSAHLIPVDPRFSKVSTGSYDGALSKAQEAGLSTFGYITKVFLARILSDNNSLSELDFAKINEIYDMDYKKLYISFESLIKQYKFVK